MVSCKFTHARVGPQRLDGARIESAGETFEARRAVDVLGVAHMGGQRLVGVGRDEAVLHLDDVHARDSVLVGHAHERRSAISPGHRSRRSEGRQGGGPAKDGLGIHVDGGLRDLVFNDYLTREAGTQEETAVLFF